MGSSPLENARAEGRLCINIQEAAPILGCSRAMAYEMARSGKLPTILLGQRRRVVPIAQLERLLSEVNGATAP